MSTPEIRAIVTPLSLALFLFMLGVFADYHDLAFSLDNLALLAYFLYGRFHFHIITASISVSIVYLER